MRKHSRDGPLASAAALGIRMDNRGRLVESDTMDIQWPRPVANRISEVTRRNLLDALLLGNDDYHGRMDAVDFLGRVWPLVDMPSTDRREPHLYADLRRHISWGDYDDTQVLFGILGIATCPDQRFGKFLAECLHPLVRTDRERVAVLLAMFNEHLARDGFVLVETSRVSGYPIFEMAALASEAVKKARHYDVALSFAGKQRKYVDAVAAGLEAACVHVFYDRFEDARLWGEDLSEVFEKVFLHGARFVVMSTSREYAEKMWPTYERRAAVEAAMARRGAYILPVRFDDTSIPGVRATVGYQDARTKSPSDIVNLILAKLAEPVADGAG